MQIVVRPALATDVDGLGDLHVRAWRAAYRGMIADDFLDGLDVGERVEGWRARLAGLPGDRTVLVAEIGGDVCGFVSFGPVDSESSGLDPDPATRDLGPSTGELYAINVRPDRWGAGVGRALLTAAHAGLAAGGYEDAVLWVLPANRRARTIYERYHWRDDGVERDAEIHGILVPELRYRRTMP